MVELDPGCVTLENAKCTADYSMGRWFCPRAFYTQWSEAWLERVSSDS
jgi:hypothetical protein